MSEKVPNRKIGGHARAEKLSSQERSRSAAKAAAARWGIPYASHDGALNLAGWKNIPCWVLEDERRLISQRSFMDVIGMGHGSKTPIGERVSQILDPRNLKSESVLALVNQVEKPIRFFTPEGLHGMAYSGEIIVDFCKAVLYARRVGNLAGVALDYADQAERLLVAVAKTGIAALIDEATGYQEIRAKDALAKILEQYVAEEWQPWTKTFPDEFYRNIYKLRKWEWGKINMHRPRVLGLWTDDFVYCRLAPGVRDELRKVNPKTESGRRKQKHHQWLTGDIGHPELRSLIDGVIRLMRGSRTWGEFKKAIDQYYPRMVPAELGFEVPLSRDPKDHLLELPGPEPTAKKYPSSKDAPICGELGLVIPPKEDQPPT
ncbi:P63C domain-containing protein [Prosthecobacter sp.]